MKTFAFVLALVALPVGTFPTTARAQALAAPHDAAKVDSAYSALKRGRYETALPLFNELRLSSPETLEYQACYALCLYETGKLALAQETYQKILEIDPDNILGLLSIARIDTRVAAGESDPQRQAEGVENAREALRHAAREGANCLRAIKTYPEFERFKNEVSLTIQLIREPQYLLPTAPKDPFLSVLVPIDPTTGKVDGPLAKRELTLEEQRAVVARLDSLLSRIEAFAKDDKIDEIARLWPEVDEILARKDLTDISLIEVVKKHRARAGRDALAFDEGIRRAYYFAGERVVKQMEADFGAQSYAAVIDGWKSLQRHAETMTHTNAKFQPLADDLLKRGLVFAEKAQTLAEIDRLKFDITGIVSSGSASKAVVNNRIVAENDLVFDQRGNPIADLRVASIAKRRVKFSYKGLEFERTLAAVNR